MPSIINGLFSGRTGISSHGAAIAVVGDNISNANTTGYKAARSEFEDIVAGGQASGIVIGSGSQLASVSTIFQQGTLEFSGRPLDLAVDGNGFFVVEKDSQRFYTRAGNFKVDEEGFIINQNGLYVLGYPSGGTGGLERVNINTVSQDSVATVNSAITGNLNAAADDDGLAWPTVALNAAVPVVLPASTYADINAMSEYSNVVDVFDTLGAKHQISLFFDKTASNTWQVRAFAPSDDLDLSVPLLTGQPRQLTTLGGDAAAGTFTLDFDSAGQLITATSGSVKDLVIPWNNGSGSQTITLDLTNFTQYATASNVTAITQDGKGIGTVGNVNISKDGSIFALLSNGQAAVIGVMGLANFSNQEGLVRLGGTLLQQSPESGEPVIGRPESGTFGGIQSGSLELSTVDIANEFVKLITLQRGFQANSRIINTINSLLNEIVQLV